MKILTQTRTFSKPNNSKLRFKDSSRNYYSRLKSGHGFEEHIVNYFKEELSLVLHPCGLDYKSPEAKSVLIELNGPAAEHMRYEPDFFAYIQSIQDIIYIEAKREITATKNYSINLNQYNELWAWSTRGIRTLYVFPPLVPSTAPLAEWIENIDQIKSRTVTSTNKLTRVNGSRKPFILIPKSKLRDIKEVLSDLPGSNPKDIPAWEKAYQRP